jgi:signal transduction protein with GAF and PtsI domain
MADLDEQKRYEEIERADRAKALLENPMLKVALDDIENEVLVGLENTHDEAVVLKLHRMFVYGRKFRNILLDHIQTGKMAVSQLEQKRKFKLWSSN